MYSLRAFFGEEIGNALSASPAPRRCVMTTTKHPPSSTSTSTVDCDGQLSSMKKKERVASATREISSVTRPCPSLLSSGRGDSLPPPRGREARVQTTFTMQCTPGGVLRRCAGGVACAVRALFPPGNRRRVIGGNEDVITHSATNRTHRTHRTRGRGAVRRRRWGPPRDGFSTMGAMYSGSSEQALGAARARASYVPHEPHSPCPPLPPFPPPALRIAQAAFPYPYLSPTPNATQRSTTRGPMTPHRGSRAPSSPS